MEKLAIKYKDEHVFPLFYKVIVRNFHNRLDLIRYLKSNLQNGYFKKKEVEKNYKRCNSCGSIYLINSDNFQLRRNGKVDGDCKTCISKKNKIRYRKRLCRK